MACDLILKCVGEPEFCFFDDAANFLVFFRKLVKRLEIASRLRYNWEEVFYSNTFEKRQWRLVWMNSSHKALF